MRQNLGDLGHQNALRIDACHLISQICRQILLKQGSQTAHSQGFFFFFSGACSARGNNEHVSF